MFFYEKWKIPQTLRNETPFWFVYHRKRKLIEFFPRNYLRTVHFHQLFLEPCHTGFYYIILPEGWQKKKFSAFHFRIITRCVWKKHAYEVCYEIILYAGRDDQCSCMKMNVTCLGMTFFSLADINDFLSWSRTHLFL